MRREKLSRRRILIAPDVALDNLAVTITLEPLVRFLRFLDRIIHFKCFRIDRRNRWFDLSDIQFGVNRSKIANRLEKLADIAVLVTL